MSSSAITISEQAIKVVQLETSVPYAEVIARLDEEVNKAGSKNIVDTLRDVATQEEFVAAVNRTVKTDFLYFGEVPHHRMLRFHDVARPAIVVYTIGNPTIAQVILKHNPLAAYSIPPRLLILEKPNEEGAVVHYYLPSSVMGLPNGDNPAELEKELQALDARVQRLAQKITAGPGKVKTVVL